LIFNSVGSNGGLLIKIILPLLEPLDHSFDWLLAMR